VIPIILDTLRRGKPYLPIVVECKKPTVEGQIRIRQKITKKSNRTQNSPLWGRVDAKRREWFEELLGKTKMCFVPFIQN